MNSLGWQQDVVPIAQRYSSAAVRLGVFAWCKVCSACVQLYSVYQESCARCAASRKK